MRKTVLGIFLSGVMLAACPLPACENDSESDSYERGYQQQYEQDERFTLNTSAGRSRVAMAGAGVGTLLLATGIGLTFLLRRRKPTGLKP